MKTITVALALGTVVLAACGSSDSNKSSDAGAPAAGTTAVASASGGAYGSASTTSSRSSDRGASGSKVTETLHDNYFGTKTISGKPGAKVKVTLTNEGSNQHNFKIDSQKNVDADLSPGQTKTVTVTIPTTGSVQFYCEYHRGIGMVGTVKAS